MKKKKEEAKVIKAEEAGVAVKKKRKKAPIIIGIVLALFLVLRLVSCALTPDMGAVVITASAERGDLQESISTSGLVASGETKVVFSEVNGTIDQVMVAAGDLVHAGDLLISFDMEEMENKLEQAALQHTMSNAAYQGLLADNAENNGKLSEADTNLAVLEQQLADYKAYLKTLQNELNESKRVTSNELASSGLSLTQRQYELENELKNVEPDSDRAKEIQKELTDIASQMAQNNYLQSIASNSDYVAETEQKIAEVQEHISECEEYKAKMESQKSTSEASVMSSYDKEQRTADNELAHMTYQDVEDEYNAAKRGVVAEFDGIITECTAISGAAVTKSVQLLTLASSEDVKVTFQASKHDVEKLEVGQSADVTIAGTVYQGEISKIDHMASVGTSNTPMVGVEVQLLDPDDKIILGMDARLNIYTHKSENTLLVPVEAINTDKEGDFLYVVEEGIVVRKPIVCGISSDTYTEVLEGITEADQIILTSYTALEEGMAVTAMQQ